MKPTVDQLHTGWSDCAGNCDTSQVRDRNLCPYRLQRPATLRQFPPNRHFELACLVTYREFCGESLRAIYIDFNAIQSLGPRRTLQGRSCGEPGIDSAGDYQLVGGNLRIANVRAANIGGKPARAKPGIGRYILCGEQRIKRCLGREDAAGIYRFSLAVPALGQSNAYGKT